MLTSARKPVEYETHNTKIFTSPHTRHVTPSVIEFRSDMSPNSPCSNDETKLDVSKDFFSDMGQKEDECVEKQILELNEGIAALQETKNLKSY